MATVDQMLLNYARLPLWALGMHEHPRPLFIRSEVEPNCTDVIALIVDEAQKMGCEPVDVQYQDPRILRSKFLYSKDKNKTLVPDYVNSLAYETLFRKAAYLGVVANSEFGVYDDVDPKFPIAYAAAMKEARQPLSGKMLASLHPWNLFCAPSEPWAKKMGVSVMELRKMLFKVTGADRDDPLAYYERIIEALARRREMLDSLTIDHLRFLGSGTDLTVGLTGESKWVGGSQRSKEYPLFTPNWPHYEVFTTPDWRRTEGHVAITKPASFMGNVVRDLKLRFEKGRIVSFEASEGYKAYKALLEIDAGAAQLGEVALVGLDSPIQQLERIFYLILLDENCACHIATGSSYPSGIKGGAYMPQQQYTALGCNESKTHVDVMVSNAQTDVFAYTREGREVQLLSKGHWCEQFK
jgi:aminopeptidase